MGNTNLDIDYQTTDEEVGSSEVRKADLKKFIDELPHLDEVDKYWARKDMPQLLAEGVDVQDIKDKYSFYDHLAEMQNEMFKNVPKEKQEEIRNVIRRVTSKESKGKDRDAKLEHVLRIKKTIEALHEKQINLKFLVEEKVLSGDVHFGVVEILNAEIFEEVAKIFPARFWRLADDMNPVNFPNFTTLFNFALKETFMQGKALKEIKKFSAQLKNSALNDAQEMLMNFFSKADQRIILQSLTKLDSRNPTKILQALLDLRTQQEKNQMQAKQSMVLLRRNLLIKNFKAVEIGIINLKNKFGANILVALGENNFEDRLKKDQLEDQNKQKKPVLDSKAEEVLAERNKGREHEKIIEKKKKEEVDNRKEKPETVNLSEASESKKMKIKFYEKTIEHARAVIQKCGELKVPTDDPKFWGLDGVRNRVARLKERGKWNDYVKFNQSDRNMPSRAYAGGFRFRWLDAKTGSNLTAGRAEEGIKYLNRYKESGYAVAVLAGAFSVDWKGASSPVYSPEKFILLVEEELNKLRGVSISKAA